MRRLTLALLAATIAATPAAAQQTRETTAMDPVPTNNTDPSLSAGAVPTDRGVNPDMPGLAGGPQEIQGAPTTMPAQDATDATVTPETNEGAGFPWGLLGLLGLVGLIGRLRSGGNGAA